MNNLNPSIWGPHYWFVLHTSALCYPDFPNEIMIKKYYNFIQNFSLIIPNDNMSKNFSNLLAKYPIEPYLKNKKLLVKWTNFIHNKINKSINKPEITLNDFYINYNKNFEPVKNKIVKKNKFTKIITFAFLIVILWLIIYYLNYQ